MKQAVAHCNSTPVAESSAACTFLQLVVVSVQVCEISAIADEAVFCSIVHQQSARDVIA